MATRRSKDNDKLPPLVAIHFKETNTYGIVPTSRLIGTKSALINHNKKPVRVIWEKKITTAFIIEFSNSVVQLEKTAKRFLQLDVKAQESRKQKKSTSVPSKKLKSTQKTPSALPAKKTVKRKLNLLCLTATPEKDLGKKVQYHTYHLSEKAVDVIKKLRPEPSATESPPVTDTLVPVTLASPPVSNTPVAVSPASPPVTDTPVPVSPASPPVSNTPVAVSPASPPVTDTPVPVSPASPPVSNTPVAVSPASPPVTDTPVPVSPASPPVTDTPVPVSPASPPVTDTPVPVSPPSKSTQTPGYLSGDVYATSAEVLVLKQAIRKNHDLIQKILAMLRDHVQGDTSVKPGSGKSYPFDADVIVINKPMPDDSAEKLYEEVCQTLNQAVDVDIPDSTGNTSSIDSLLSPFLIDSHPSPEISIMPESDTLSSPLLTELHQPLSLSDVNIAPESAMYSASPLLAQPLQPSSSSDVSAIYSSPLLAQPLQQSSSSDVSAIYSSPLLAQPHQPLSSSDVSAIYSSPLLAQPLQPSSSSDVSAIYSSPLLAQPHQPPSSSDVSAIYSSPLLAQPLQPSSSSDVSAIYSSPLLAQPHLPPSSSDVSAIYSSPLLAQPHQPSSSSDVSAIYSSPLLAQPLQPSSSSDVSAIYSSPLLAQPLQPSSSSDVSAIYSSPLLAQPHQPSSSSDVSAIYSSPLLAQPHQPSSSPDVSAIYSSPLLAQPHQPSSSSDVSAIYSSPLLAQPHQPSSSPDVSAIYSSPLLAQPHQPSTSSDTSAIYSSPLVAQPHQPLSSSAIFIMPELARYSTATPPLLTQHHQPPSLSKVITQKSTSFSLPVQSSQSSPAVSLDLPLQTSTSVLQPLPNQVFMVMDPKFWKISLSSLMATRPRDMQFQLLMLPVAPVVSSTFIIEETLIHEAKRKSPDCRKKFATHIFRKVFSIEDTYGKNVQGKVFRSNSVKEPINVIKMNILKFIVMQNFPCSEADTKKVWTTVVRAIDKANWSINNYIKTNYELTAIRR